MVLRRICETILLIASWALFLLSLAVFYLRVGRSIDPNRLFNPDTLYAASLYKDVFIDGFSWSGWVFPPAPYFFPDVLFSAVGYWLSGEYVATTAALGALQITLLTLGCILLAREILEGISLVETVPFVAGVSLLVLRTTGDEFFFVVGPLYTPVTHAGAFVVALFVLALVVRVIRVHCISWGAVTAVALLTLLTSASDQLFIADLVVPLAAAMLLSLRADSIHRHKSLLLVIVLISSALSGFILAKLVIPHPAWSNYYSFSGERAWAALREFSTDLRLFCENYPLLVSIWFASLGASLISILACRRILGSHPGAPESSTPSAHKILSLVSAFALLSAIVVLLSTLATGNYTNIWCFRYLLATWLFPLCVSCAAAVFLMHQRPLPRILVNTSLLLLVAWKVSFGLPNIFTERFLLNYYPPLLECLDKHQDQFHLRYGLSNYWHARPFTLLSRNNLRIYQITPTGDPHLWINNQNWYFGERASLYPDPSYRFIIVDEGSKRSIAGRIGPPQEKLVCGSTEVWIYSAEATKKLMDAWLDRLPPSVVSSSPRFESKD